MAVETRALSVGLCLLVLATASCRKRTFHAPPPDEARATSRVEDSTTRWPACVDRLLKWETQANAVSRVDDSTIALEHYELPRVLLAFDKDDGTTARWANVLEFEKNGAKWVRWIVHPDDTKWTRELEDWMRRNYLDPVRHTYYRG